VFVLSAVLGRLFGGFLSDWYMARFRISRKPVLYFTTLGVGLAALLCFQVDSTLEMILVSVLLGFCYGSGLAVFPTYLGDLFGVRNVAVLFGVGALFVGGLGAVGPVLYGFSYDATGSYNLAFLVTGVLCIASAICLFLLKRPRKKRKVS
jgi:OFA family oxalate/formate antiporter-like MFS transporter